MIVISHGGCADGVACGYIMKKKYPKAYVHYTNIRNFYEDKNMPDITDKIVYITDYSYDSDTIRYMAKLAKNIYIYDHHKTAMQLSTDLPRNVKLFLDNSKCGAEIVWNSEMITPQPWWMVHVRDRDLWLWEHPESRNFSAAFIDMGKICELNYGILTTFNATQIRHFYNKGAMLLDFQEKVVQKICAAAELVKFQEYNVVAVNCGIYQSEVGNALADRADFAIMYRYSIENKKWYISLRGKGKHDLSKIAQSFGGGGHANASGFEFIGDFTTLLK